MKKIFYIILLSVFRKMNEINTGSKIIIKNIKIIY